MPRLRMTTNVESEVPRHRRPDRTIDDVRLPAAIRWPLLTALVILFLFGGKAPVWHDPFDIDRAIYLSYAAIPPLVGAGLWWSKRLSTMTLLLNTMEIALCKFAATYCIAMVLWAGFRRPAPEPDDRVPRSEAAVTPVVAPDPTPWPTDRRASISGVVKDGDGANVSDALVYISRGLDKLVFERPAEPLELRLGNDDFGADLIVARRWQPLVGRSGNGGLHTLLIDRGNRSTRAVPILPSGARSPLPIHDVNGVVSIRCTVHRARADLAVLHHPFHMRTGSDGRFELRDVPALEVTVTAWTKAAQGHQESVLTPGGSSAVVVTLSP